MKIPKGFTSHPAVDFVETADTNGSDYKYIVHLKNGWRYTAGRAEGTECCTALGVMSVTEFKEARPERGSEQ